MSSRFNFNCVTTRSLLLAATIGLGTTAAHAAEPDKAPDSGPCRPATMPISPLGADGLPITGDVTVVATFTTRGVAPIRFVNGEPALQEAVEKALGAFKCNAEIASKRNRYTFEFRNLIPKSPVVYADGPFRIVAAWSHPREIAGQPLYLAWRMDRPWTEIGPDYVEPKAAAPLKPELTAQVQQLPGGHWRAEVAFVVESDGRAGDMVVLPAYLPDPVKDMCRSAVMQGTFEPAKYRGAAVAGVMHQPFIINLQ